MSKLDQLQYISNILKPYKGHIEVINTREHPELVNKYGQKNLGYLYICDFKDHPEFKGMASYGGRTSLVVSETINDGGKSVLIETLNTYYTRDLSGQEMAEYFDKEGYCHNKDLGCI